MDLGVEHARVEVIARLKRARCDHGRMGSVESSTRGGDVHGRCSARLGVAFDSCKPESTVGSRFKRVRDFSNTTLSKNGLQWSKHSDGGCERWF